MLLAHYRRYGSRMFARSQLSVTLCLIFITPTQEFSGFNGGGLTRVLETHHTHACDGDHVTIKCPVRTVISIQYAKYGRSVPSSVMCPITTDKPTLRDLLLLQDSPLIENTNCIAVRSLEIMLDLCEDRPNCLVKASPETFTQDPCVGTHKYLEAHYKCRPNEFERQTVCEGEKLQISCDSGDRIVVYSAMFGRIPNGTDKCRTNKQRYIDCQAIGALSVVKTHCQGRKSCAILASESAFGDPCASGIKKYLTVSYTCVPKKILKRLPPKPNNNKKRKRKKKKKKGGSQVNATSEIDSSLDHHHLQTSTPEVYETFEQMSVTQKIPRSGSSSNKNINFSTLKESGGKRLDITTIQDEAVQHEGFTTQSSRKHHSKNNKGNNSGINGRQDFTTGIRSTTESSILLYNISKSSKDMSGEYNVRDNNDNKENGYRNLDKVAAASKESDSIRNADNQPSNKISNSNKQSGSGSKNNLNKDTNLNIAAAKHTPILNTTLTYDSRNRANGQGSRTTGDPAHIPTSSGKGHPESPYVTERNLTVLCMNYTRPGVRWGSIVRPKDEFTIGFLRDWFSVVHFLQTHQEKAWLYFTLGICFGIIVMLIVVLIKVCINFRRNIRARLDMTEPTHCSAHKNNHSSLEAPMLEHSDSIDQIEVVRFSPQSPLHGHRSNSHHRDLVNYYG